MNFFPIVIKIQQHIFDFPMLADILHLLRCDSFFINAPIVQLALTVVSLRT